MFREGGYHHQLFLEKEKKKENGKDSSGENHEKNSDL